MTIFRFDTQSSAVYSILYYEAAVFVSAIFIKSLGTQHSALKSRPFKCFSRLTNMQSVHVRTYFHGHKALIALNNFSVYILTTAIIMQVMCRSKIPEFLNGLLTYLLLLSCNWIVTIDEKRRKIGKKYRDLVILVS